MKIIRKLALVVIILAATTLSRVYGIGLETTGIQNLHVVLSSNNDSMRISGKSLNTSWPVKNVTAKKRGHDIIVSVNLALFNKRGKGASFCKTIKMRPDIQRVLLGHKRVVIWQRVEK